MDLSLLIICTILTSAFAAIMGQGGGLILIAILAGTVPSTSLVAIHGVIQASSNGSRALLAHKDIHWHIIMPVCLGIILGGTLILPFISQLNWQWMQLFIGLYILWSTWNKYFIEKIPKKLKRLFAASPNKEVPNSYSLLNLGMAQGALGMLLGATGPLGNALLLKKGLNKNQIIASNGVIMFTSHLIKIIFFSILGVQLLQFANLLIYLSIAAIVGSFIGSHFRQALPEWIFFPLFKALLSILALRMCFIAFN